MNQIKKILHHLFVPHHGNNYRAKTLHHDFLTLYLLFALLTTAGIKYLQMNNGTVLGYATDISTAKLLELTNAERQKNNLPPLKYNAKLEVAAQKKAQDMFGKNYWAHYGPDGTTPWNFIIAAGYQYEYAGENLAKNFLFSKGVMEGWMGSKTHRENVLRKEYTDVGFSVTNGVLNGEETTLVVQMFGKPLQPDLAKVAAQQPAAVVEQHDTTPNNPVLAAGAPVVAQKKTVQSSFLSVPTLFNANIFFILFLLTAFIIDFYIAARMNLIRVTGKNIIHALFLVFVLTATYIISRGGTI